MLAEDIPIWYRFLDKWGHLFLRVYYDVLLGGPDLTPKQREDPIMRMWRQVNCKRADVIAELSDQIWIIEVAYRPSLRPLGQLMTYWALYLEDPKFDKPEYLAMVTDKEDTDLFAAAAKFGVAIYLIPVE
jgi:hypothetical protein